MSATACGHRRSCHHPAHGEHELPQLVFQHVVRSAALAHVREHFLLVRAARAEDDGYVGGTLAHVVHGAAAVETGHAGIEDHHVVAAGLDGVAELLAIARMQNVGLDAVPLQHALDDHRVGGAVFEVQNLHARSCA